MLFFFKHSKMVLDVSVLNFTLGLLGFWLPYRSLPVESSSGCAGPPSSITVLLSFL